MKKSLIKKLLIGLGILIFLLLTPSFIQIFKLYIYNPYTEPAPEDFYIRSEQPPFQGFNPLPEEEVDISYSGDGKRTYITHHKDGYKLNLPSDLTVSTWDMDKEVVKIFEEYEDGTACIASTYKLDDEKTVQESFQNSLKYDEEDAYMYTVLRRELEKIEDPSINKEAYIEHYEELAWGYQPHILIQGDGVVFGISQNGERYPECDLMMRVLKGFRFINEEL